MPAERVSMRRVREILRLKYECGISDRAIAVAVGVARSTVRLCLDRVAVAGLSWPLPATVSDQRLEALLFAPLGGSQPGHRHKAEPDWTAVHHELRRPGVTLLLLWEEYRAIHSSGYGYSRWCELYRSWPSDREAVQNGHRLGPHGGDQRRALPEASLTWPQKPVFRPCSARRRATKPSCFSKAPKSRMPGASEAHSSRCRAACL